MRKNLLLSLLCLTGLQSFNLINASLGSKFTKLNPTRLFNNAVKKQFVRNVCNKPESEETPLSQSLWSIGAGIVGGTLGEACGGVVQDFVGGRNGVLPKVGGVAGASYLAYRFGGRTGLRSFAFFIGTMAVFSRM